jgi:hypothetical protein
MNETRKLCKIEPESVDFEAARRDAEVLLGTTAGPSTWGTPARHRADNLARAYLALEARALEAEREARRLRKALEWVAGGPSSFKSALKMKVIARVALGWVAFTWEAQVDEVWRRRVVEALAPTKEGAE